MVLLYIIIPSKVIRVPPAGLTNISVSKDLDEILPQGLDMGVLLLEVINGNGIRDGLD